MSATTSIPSNQGGNNSQYSSNMISYNFEKVNN